MLSFQKGFESGVRMPLFTVNFTNIREKTPESPGASPRHQTPRVFIPILPLCNAVLTPLALTVRGLVEYQIIRSSF